jgi:hypothetical protein
MRRTSRPRTSAACVRALRAFPPDNPAKSLTNLSGGFAAARRSRLTARNFAAERRRPHIHAVVEALLVPADCHHPCGRAEHSALPDYDRIICDEAPASPAGAQQTACLILHRLARRGPRGIGEFAIAP